MTPEHSLPPLIKRTVPTNPVTKVRDSLLNDAYLILESKTLGKPCLVQKKTPYELHPADVMVAMPDNQASQLTDLSLSEGAEFLGLCGFMAKTMYSTFGRGIPIVAVNQQPECRNIPYKYSNDGTELKVQTIDELHAHVFVEDYSGERYLPVNRLGTDSRYDFYDPYAMAFSEGLLNRIVDRLGGLKKYPKIDFSQGTFPLGINIVWGNDLATALKDPALYKFIIGTQEDIIGIYESIETMIMNIDGSLVDKDRRRLVMDVLCGFGGELSDKCKRMAASFFINLKSSAEESRKYMRLIKGPALTWAFYERNGSTNINLTPRIVSRGNAMEMFGIWVETGGNADESRLIIQDAYFIELARSLGTSLNMRYGPALGRRFSDEES